MLKTHHCHPCVGRRLQQSCAIRWISLGSRKSSSTFANLYSELTSRRLPLLYDKATYVPSHLLDVTLADFLPPSQISGQLNNTHTPAGRGPQILPGHHLIYFPPPSPLSALLPDGTDPDQSPGEPFVRRMWAGGRISFRPSNRPYFNLNAQPAFCLERISDVNVKGNSGDEKIFVTIERRVSRTMSRQILRKTMGKYSNEAEDEIRQRLLDDRQCSVVEHRNIVFMRKHNPTAVLDAASRVERIVKPQHEPTYSHVLTPTPAMLFRFSALTFNAHRIHLDRQYCLATEGHRNLLVHGPLSLILMIELLRRYLSREGSHVLSAGLREKEQITEIEYRNLAPLYADEPMRVCVRRKKEGEWEVWIEGRDGGYAVKGVAKTSMKDIFEEKHLTLATTGSVQSS